jgi:hypothetical protein
MECPIPTKIKAITAGKGHLSMAAVIWSLAASNNLDQSLLRQPKWRARIPDLDRAYLVRRIRQESGNPSLTGCRTTQMADQIQSLEDFCREMEAWRQQVGLTEVDDREMQNSGE